MEILAVVSMESTKVGGGAPIFYAQDQDQLFKLAALLASALNAAVHDLQNGALIIIRH